MRRGAGRSKSRRRFDPLDVLRDAMEELYHSQAEFADILGSRSRATEVLARLRPLILKIIQNGKTRPISRRSLIGSSQQQLERDALLDVLQQLS
jgi:hypothetical protein